MAMTLPKYPNRGLTLMELMVAMTIVGIVMIGVMSADYAIRKQSADAFGGTNAQMTAQAIMTHIMANAFNATGNNADKGILIGPGVGDANSFCIRDGVAPWICYTSDGVSGDFYTCKKSAVGACTAADTGYKKLGTLSSIITSFTLNNTMGTQQMVFTVNLQISDATTLTGTRNVNAAISPPRHAI